MKIVTVAALAAASLSLGACAGFTVPGLNGAAASSNDAMMKFLTDPSCAHHDEATFVTGAAGVPASFQAKLVRDCPARPAIPADNPPAS